MYQFKPQPAFGIVEGLSLNEISKRYNQKNDQLTILSFLKKKNQQKTNKERTK
tara:strand:- start:1138 stop:1296 length:159 start_codon:yes stop_codon:yes gene_type:complete